ncbi:MAG: HD-GYP domain-containing protein [Lachnospiraceae bacterium]|nr:HD-GYP domain-containing protein [Lachnospiraceae bacterium]
MSGKNEEIAFVSFAFANIIVYLFIWAFYVIIKNMMATNEAIKAKEEIKTLSVEVMEALAHTIDAKDEYTKGHSVRVAKYSRMLAEKLGLNEGDCESVYYMALLHDIGKIGVPNEIINSKSKMTDEEYAIMKTHPAIGSDILEEIKSRPDLMIGARWHHERYDGKGYPDQKAGEDIPYFARIISVADSYDAMTSNRSYRNYLPQDVVRGEIEKNCGTQFDPNVAKCMLSIIDEDVNYEYHE